MIAANFNGTLPTWLAVVGIAVLAYIQLRGGSATAIEGLQSTNRELVRQVHERGERIESLEARVKLLEQKTDVTLAIAPLIVWSESHERNAAERHKATLKVLDLIAERLGPEPNGD